MALLSSDTEYDATQLIIELVVILKASLNNPYFLNDNYKY